MKTGDIVRKFGVSEATVRRWMTDFQEFLSERQGRQRNYTHDDYLTIATIHQLFQSGLTQKSVKEKLREGYRVNAEDISEIGYSDGRMVPAVVVEQVIDSANLRAELEQVKYERDRLMELLKHSEKVRSDLQNELSEKVGQLQQEIGRLQRELGRAEARAEIYKENLDRFERTDNES